MNSLKRYFLLAVLLLIGVGLAVAQPTWNFTKTIHFPVEDSVFARPLLCTMDAAGNLWVISSNNVDANAHNMLYKLIPGDSVMTRMIDYTASGDPQVKSTRGVASVGNDVFVAHHRPDAGTTVSSMMVYRNGDTTKRELYAFGLGQSGYGTYLFGLAATRDTALIAGMSFGTKPRLYNFNRTFAPGFGSYMGVDITATEAGGANLNGIDIIRDVATIPNADYSQATTVFYTSRNSSVDHPTSGGIAVWIGGTQTAPANYRSKRAADFFAELALGTSVPYGITVDALGNVYVAGVDTLRRWVKGYTIDTSGTATSYAELPSATDPFNANPAGAPFVAPCDVAFTADGATAYVVDAYAKKIFKFAVATDVSPDPVSLPTSIDMSQNYPNPFNPMTTIRLSLPIATHAALKVYDALGRPIATLVDRAMSAGTHYVPFDALQYGLSSGVYYYRLTADGMFFSKSMILTK